MVDTLYTYFFLDEAFLYAVPGWSNEQGKLWVMYTFSQYLCFVSVDNYAQLDLKEQKNIIECRKYKQAMM